jgi:hypothetical protein
MTWENAVTWYGLTDADLVDGYFVANEIDSLLRVKIDCPRQELPVVRNKWRGGVEHHAAKDLPSDEPGGGLRERAESDA